MVIVLASPTPVVAPDGSSVEMTWTGWDGSVWSLHDGIQGVMMEARGLVGLHNPPITKFESQARGIPGSRLRGWRAGKRPVKWPVMVERRSRAEDWFTAYDAFFNSIHPLNEGVWAVTVNGHTRTLRLTGEFDGDHAYQVDPLLLEWAQYDVVLEAAQPFWEGEKIAPDPWSAGEPVDFIDEDGAPSFHLSESSTFANATVDNPGDVDAFPVWTFRGPFDEVSVTVDGKTLAVPFELVEGSVLRVDTDPRRLSAVLDGVDARRDLGFQSYGPVPAKGTSKITIGASGTGSVAMELTPLYFRAF
ncbi:hypothetical protein [Microbacterium sp.]|uniref:hypothetical protein n=1 Tax=Microbacterium sp. TaxID=51671 RepID=UPI0039E55E02